MSYLGCSDLPPNLVKYGVICGLVHHLGNTEDDPAFAKTPRPNDVSEVNNGPALVPSFVENFMPTNIDTIPKLVAYSKSIWVNTERSKNQQLGYKDPILQKLTNMQLNTTNKITSNREVRSRTKTGSWRTLRPLAERVIFKSLKGLYCFNKTFHDPKPYDVTGSWQCFFYEFANIPFY